MACSTHTPNDGVLNCNNNPHLHILLHLYIFLPEIHMTISILFKTHQSCSFTVDDSLSLCVVYAMRMCALEAFSTSKIKCLMKTFSPRSVRAWLVARCWRRRGGDGRRRRRGCRMKPTIDSSWWRKKSRWGPKTSLRSVKQNSAT